MVLIGPFMDQKAHVNTYLLTERLDLALCELLAFVKLLDPLIQFLRKRLFVHIRLKNFLTDYYLRLTDYCVSNEAPRCRSPQGDHFETFMWLVDRNFN